MASNQLESYADILYTIRGLFSASEEVTLDQWNTFLQSFAISERYEGISAVGFILYSTTEDLHETLEQVRQKYSLTPIADKINLNITSGYDSHYILEYIHPFEPNKDNIGFDLFSEEARRDAILRSVKTGKIVKTKPLTLLGDTKNLNSSFVVYLPIYNKYSTIQSDEEKLGNVYGLSSLAFNFNDLMNAVLVNYSGTKINLTIYSKSDIDSESRNVLYESNNLNASKELEYTIPYEFAGEDWEFVFQTGEYYDISSESIRNRNLLIILFAISGYVAFTFMYLGLKRTTDNTKN